MHTIGEKRIRMLKPREIKRPQTNLRTDIDKRELNLLRDSISASGVLQPLLVRKIKRGKYELVSGNRRLLAAIMLGLRRVPCVVHNVGDKDALLYSLTENLQTKGLLFFDEANAINLLITRYGMSREEVALYLGISQTELYSKLQLLRFDKKSARRITGAGLSEGHALALLKLPVVGRPSVLDTVIENKFTLSETEEYIFSLLNPPQQSEEKAETEQKEETPIRKYAIGDPRLFSNSLVKLVDTLKDSGVKVSFRKTENDTYLEYKIRIKKETAEQEQLQLKLLGS